MLKFNVTSLARRSTTLSIRSPTSTTAITLRNIITIKKSSTNSTILSPTRISPPLLRITQTLTLTNSNSCVQYYYTTSNSTLTTSIGKDQQDEKESLFKQKGERNIKEEKVEDNLRIEDGLIIKFRKAIQEGDLEKLVTIHHALKEHQQQNYLTKSDYQEAMKLLCRSTNNFTQEMLPSTKTPESAFSIIYSLFNDMKNQGYKPNTSIYNTLIYINARKGDTKESKRIYEMMLEDKIECTLYTFNSLMSSYQWSLDIKGALKVLEEMRLCGIKPDTITYNSLIDMYVKLGYINQAENIYEEMNNKSDVIADKFTFDCLLNGYLSYGHLDKAKNLFKDITNSGIELDVYLYTKLLKIYCCESGNSQKVLNLFNQIQHQQQQQQQQQKGSINYFINILLDYLVKEGEFSHTIKFYEELMGNEFIYDKDTLTIIIPAYYHIGNIDLAFELFKEKMISYTNNQRIFSSLFSNLGKEHSKNFLRQFTSSTSTSSCELYNSLIAYFLNQDDIINALEMYSHLLQQGYFLNIMNITILCKKLILQGKIDEALQLYYQSKDHNIILDQRGYTILIDSFSKMTYMQEAQRIFVDMKRNGIKPNSYTYSSLIRGLGKIYDVQGVKTVHQLIRMDLNLDQFDIVMYNSLMDAYSRCGYGYDVLQLWDSLVMSSKDSKDSDVSLINNTTVSIVLDSCGFNRQLFRLKQIWYDLKKKMFKLNQNNYTSYIEALARNHEFNEAKNVLMFEMINDGILPNSKTIRTLLNFLHDHSRGRDQYEIINWVKINFPVLAKELNLVNKNTFKGTTEKN